LITGKVCFSKMDLLLLGKQKKYPFYYKNKVIFIRKP
jgi:hypothetical protein